MSVEGTLYPGIQRLVQRGKVILTPIPEEYKKLKKKVEDRIRNTSLYSCIEFQRSGISSFVDSLFISVFAAVGSVSFFHTVCAIRVITSINLNRVEWSRGYDMTSAEKRREERRREEKRREKKR